MKLNRPALGVVIVSALLLTACGSGDGDATDATDAIAVTTSETPVFEPKDVDPVTAKKLSDSMVDPGLNVEWIYQGAASAPNGGTVVTLMVRNLNEEPLPVEAIGQPTLSYNTGSDNFSDADPVSGEDADLLVGLDLPLGSQAATNLQYVFDVSVGNLWDAKLQAGNVIWEGNLNI